MRAWGTLAAIVTLLCAGLYWGLRQNLRASANEPQVELAQDAASALAAGTAAQALIGGEKVDMARSLDPFLIILDAKGQPVASSGELDDAVPAVAPEVLAKARERGENRLTWQPRPGVRIAAVVVAYAGRATGFVLAGRSLREADSRESRLLVRLASFWGFSVFAILVLLPILR